MTWTRPSTARSEYDLALRLTDGRLACLHKAVMLAGSMTGNFQCCRSWWTTSCLRNLQLPVAKCWGHAANVFLLTLQPTQSNVRRGPSSSSTQVQLMIILQKTVTCRLLPEFCTPPSHHQSVVLLPLLRVQDGFSQVVLDWISNLCVT